MSGQRGYLSTSEKVWRSWQALRTLLRWLKAWGRGVISIWPQIDLFGPQGDSKVWFWDPWLEELLNLQHDEEIICNFPVNY